MLAAVCLQRSSLRRFVSDPSVELVATLGPSSLGGCPASCPDTYRLTHDHRHVRNRASSHISFLTPLRKIFFRLRRNFPNTNLQFDARRATALPGMNGC